MPRFGPISRRELIVALRQFGFSGPFAGAKHEFMTKGRRHLILPNPHAGDVSRDFLAEILRQAGITRAEWESL